MHCLLNIIDSIHVWRNSLLYYELGGASTNCRDYQSTILHRHADREASSRDVGCIRRNRKDRTHE